MLHVPINQKGAQILGKRREEVIGNLISDVFGGAKSFSLNPKEEKFQINAGLGEKIGDKRFDTVYALNRAG